MFRIGSMVMNQAFLHKGVGGEGEGRGGLEPEAVEVGHGKEREKRRDQGIRRDW